MNDENTAALQPNSTIRILLADDHELVRDGIRARLQRFDNLEVIGEATNGAEALALVSSLRPDVILMDISMPIKNGLEAAAEIREHHPNTAVLVLSIYDNPEYVRGVVQSGARGYILKDISASEMITAITSVASGGYYFSAAVGPTLVGGNQATAVDDPYGLTDRERQVLKAVAQGHPNKEIAKTLGISVRTVETHRLNLREKVGNKNAAQLYKVAQELGLLA
ncbi:LuxR family two component transcriptional regulator [Roseibium hamelinense]|uniref:LuxR family two component transcriptional regulator n=1 Tax=Roseibium hamelinense TaxID=150831 RepID=A0A562SLW7_9HYPH|nr:response regulator transcription factor [Roseibium hamelinense]MTI45061.1 response regulator transcription factor [Roseibium hamelinense]TWI82325.1 LuxR family two component transcriptional regulator [Roseibium hamelinense]